jgi:large subunit ribosomal protein L7/L12
MPTAAAPAAAAPQEEAPVEVCLCTDIPKLSIKNVFQEKPKEKTIFNVKLESFEAGAKPKVIREVKALVPNLTLIDVRSFHFTLAHC